MRTLLAATSRRSRTAPKATYSYKHSKRLRLMVGGWRNQGASFQRLRWMVGGRQNLMRKLQAVTFRRFRIAQPGAQISSGYVGWEVSSDRFGAYALLRDSGIYSVYQFYNFCELEGCAALSFLPIFGRAGWSYLWVSAPAGPKYTDTANVHVRTTIPIHTGRIFPLMRRYTSDMSMCETSLDFRAGLRRRGD